MDETFASWCSLTSISDGIHQKGMAAMGAPPYIVAHFGAAMDDDQRGVMPGMNDNFEKLTGRKPMSVAEFARAHAIRLNPKA